MKLRALNIFISLLVTTCIITSCLDTDPMEYEYSSNASITSFSIADQIVTYYPGKTSLGVDTTLSVAVQGSDYPFVINQMDGLIYNQDSLPIGTDISKVVVSITADTYGIYIVAETDSLWEETDSLDFNKPIQFKILSETGVFGRTYKAEINVHKQDPDSLVWNKIPSNLSTNIQAQKAVYANNNIYIFAEQESQTAMTMTSISDGKTWSTLQNIDIPTKADYTSAMAWDDKLYILANNELYTSENGLNWSKVNTQQTFSKLLACSDKMFGIDTDNHYVSSQNGIEWEQHSLMPDNYPTSDYSFVSYPLATNSQIERMVLIGKDATENVSDTITVVWSQLNTEDEWTALTFEENEFACPKLENASIIRYNNRLYTFGGAKKYLGLEIVTPFQYFFESYDNGITWNTVTKKVMFPKEFKELYQEAKGNYSYIVDDNQFIWIMWSQTGEVWRGRINKFGFKKQ